MDECHRLAKSLKRLTRIRGQTDVRLNSSTRQLASDPRSQTAEPQNNRCDVAASCPHSITAIRLECCTDRLSLPPIATEIHVSWHVDNLDKSGLVVLNVSFV